MGSLRAHAWACRWCGAGGDLGDRVRGALGAGQKVLQASRDLVHAAGRVVDLPGAAGGPAVFVEQAHQLVADLGALELLEAVRGCGQFLAGRDCSEVPATVFVCLGRDMSDLVLDDSERDLQTRGAIEHNLTRDAKGVGLDVPIAEIIR